MSRFNSSISIHSGHSNFERNDTELVSIFPKKLPELNVGPVFDECGFALNERIALRQAWSVIKPFERRYGKEIFFDFLMDNYKTFEAFRIDGKIDLFRLHRHSMSFMRFISSIIEQKDPVVFQVVLNDNYNLHRYAQVNPDYMELILKALISYVLDKLQDVSSASLESGFHRLLGKFSAAMHGNRGISFQVVQDQSTARFSESKDKV